MNAFDLDGDGKIDEAEMMAGMLKMRAPVSRERLCNDVLNTSVMAALIGGFALGSLAAPGDNLLDQITYLTAYIAVHACTCSALTSAFIYGAVNNMEEAAVEPWAKKQKMLLMLPMLKFIAGSMAYMISVILASWRDLHGLTVFRLISMAVGIMSVASVWVAFAMIWRSTQTARVAAPPSAVSPV